MTEAIAPIPASVDNPESWAAIADLLTEETGNPPSVTPESLAGLVARAVPALFAADAARDTSCLHSLFAAQVIVQCARRAGYLSGATPRSASVHLVGAPPGEAGHPIVRAHVTIDVQDPSGTEAVERQFWDFEIRTQMTVAESGCESCGAPAQARDVFCRYCGHDLRGSSTVMLAVCALKLY
jgi:hypothetical protein